MAELEFTRLTFNDFKKLYQEELEKGSETFMFADHEFEIAYAGHLIAFLESTRYIQ